MKTISKTALVALMTATIGFTAIVPTFAQEASATPGAAAHDTFRKQNQRPDQGPRQGGRMGGDFLSFERGSEAIEIALVRLSHAIDLTPEQQALFDTLRTDAVAAADTFSAAVADLRPQAPGDQPPAPPAPPAEGTAPEAPPAGDAPSAPEATPGKAGAAMERPDFAEMLETRIALETAHLAALEAVQPALTAFFDSLTDEQKAELMPSPRGNGGPGMQDQGPQGHHDKRPGASHQGGAAPAHANG